ncbi:bifunctional aldolase/short-chain dehydrogenase [endosymbiont of Ridgeia piscesae]|jgi:rhamnose utilization protein RhaD (predicted bifunctional aldolase and dehydrogenase)/NAD(P)-dependent dehydrogenase (short-subunit alcohol dehydrogenase family)|uniref:Rhamnose utilization protein RhaD, predicted bifunctional aldolase and dehydrogenase n=1 Tax=endosymbiont of Ridgeia piscesae TaxID=54398 RepID=A0A0T5Z974_9GAMM|nr:bifunctional aldolase/short-chain dehydrogenase [endosymbiont of Ridgeia piscesae]KRT53570.1 Rhamnose utilization protein RhaD, predicted bifunctional aldolase and dehydrogenase [endosymbiont of Ridgeia piscesae]KRT59434.1 Rhamnose utilization protein RhaD, predicted bifunctional aldolase and dehydrogenase [endosymbiont of Ridgeia piscesae]
MKNRWNDTEAARFTDDLQLRVYSSRLLGQDPSLVLHGGGNTSVKIRQPDLFGEAEEILYVKGSGWDLATIEAAGYTPVRMAHLLRLAELESLSDLEMVNQLKTHQTLASAPTASVEAILHATLPYKFVDHTHADAIVTITNTKDGEARIREIYGDELVIIPYVMPGFDLARLVAKAFPKQVNPNTIGMVLMNHGLFSFGESAKESYERMITLVQRAEAYLQAQGAWQLPEPTVIPTPDTSTLSALRQSLSEAAGQPMLLQSHRSPEAMSFCGRDNLATISQQGPATPDHVIRTKRLPMLGSDVAAYAEAYRDYFEQQSPQARNPVQILDPAPRVVLDPQLGMLSIGKSAKEAGIVADIYHHTMQIIQRAEQLGGWRALPASNIFDVEYWELEQAKLRTGGTPPPFQGEIALVTGAASGIGKACVESLLARGAAVVGLDLNPEITGLYDRAEFLGIRCDVTDSNAIKDALEQTLLAFGGLDMLILNAGIFPGGCPVAELTDEQWRKVMQVNLDANLSLLRECHPLLQQAPRHGRVVVIGSKNVPAPGAGAAAYSASKAALNQLARIVALEWAADGIRINSLHPDAVFDTGIWSDQVLQARADHYGMSVAEYKTRNLLKTEVTSRDVAELAAELCGELFAKTTAAQIPVDGGNDRVV